MPKLGTIELDIYGKDYLLKLKFSDGKCAVVAFPQGAHKEGVIKQLYALIRLLDEEDDNAKTYTT